MQGSSKTWSGSRRERRLRPRSVFYIVFWLPKLNVDLQIAYLDVAHAVVTYRERKVAVNALKLKRKKAAAKAKRLQEKNAPAHQKLRYAFLNWLRVNHSSSPVVSMKSEKTMQNEPARRKRQS